MAEMLFPSDGSLTSYKDRDGARLIGGVTPLDRTAWFLVAEAEYDRAFAPAIAITNQIFIVDVCIILLFSVLAYKILAQISITDGLTKLHNHRYFQGHLTREIEPVSRTRAPLSWTSAISRCSMIHTGMPRVTRSSAVWRPS